MKGNNTFARFVWVNSQGNLENGSGTAIFSDFGKLEKRQRKCKNKRKQYICQIFVNLQTSLENGSGAMWRYIFGFWKTRKTAKKVNK